MPLHATYVAGVQYYPTDMMQRDQDFISPGVITTNDLIVSPTGTPSMAVTVSGATQGSTGGNAWLPGGYRVYNDAQATLTIAAADATNPRIDLVVAAVDTTATPYTPSLQVITGTPAASPVVPSIPTGLIALILAQVAVSANATTIVAGNITDERVIAGLQGDGSRLRNIPASAMPVATDATAGAVKGSPSVIVAGDGTLSATPSSIGADPAGAAALAQSAAEAYSDAALSVHQAETASLTQLGHVKANANVSVASDGTMTVNTATNATELGGVVAADYAQLDVANMFTQPQTFNGFQGYFVTTGSSYTIPLSAVGGYLLFNGATTNEAWTMPDASQCVGGKLVVRNNTLSYTLTLQTVNSQEFNGNTSATTQTVLNGETAIFYSTGSGWVIGGGSNFNLFGGNVIVGGTVTASSGQLGSATGSFAPSSGTYNLASGYVLNVASVPSGVRLFNVMGLNGANAGMVMGGITGSFGSTWSLVTASGGTVASGYAGGLSSGTAYGAVATLYDGSYKINGYFQVNGGYLQFVSTSAGVAYSATQSTFDWGVA